MYRRLHHEVTTETSYEDNDNATCSNAEEASMGLLSREGPRSYQRGFMRMGGHSVMYEN
jgi:hypothetical protein